MEPHVAAAGYSTTGWVIGYTIGGVVVLAIVALVVPILLLARSIGDEAPTKATFWPGSTPSSGGR